MQYRVEIIKGVEMGEEMQILTKDINIKLTNMSTGCFKSHLHFHLSGKSACGIDYAKNVMSIEGHGNTLTACRLPINV